MAFVLGVDGGGTKTHSIVADETGSVLGFATDGPSNWEMVGLDGAERAIAAAVSASLESAGISRGDVAASVFGLAGLDWDSDAERLRRATEPLGLSGERALVNDSLIALRAGSSRPWGVVVIAGTGTVAAGRNHGGEVFRTLGLGPEFGDWGSASDVSLDALRAVAYAYTGRGPHTLLTDLYCRAAGVASAAALLERASRSDDRAGGENVAPIVVEAAEAGDAVARDILERAGASLGESGALVARRLEMLDESFEVVLAGGLFRGGSSILENAVEVTVRHAAHHAVLVHLDAPPVVGAALMALETASADLYPGVQQRLSAGAARALREHAG